MRFTPHLVMGLCVMLLGVLLVFDRMGILAASVSLQYWPVALVLLGASLAVQAFRGTPEGETHRKPHFPVGFLIVIIVVGSIFTHRSNRIDQPTVDASNKIRQFAVMGGSERVSTAANFQGAEMTAIMGGHELDLRKATIPDGETRVIDVFAVMGGMKLRVPKEWLVDIQVSPIIGGVADNRQANPVRRRLPRRQRRWGDDMDDESAVVAPPVPATPPEVAVAPQEGVTPAGTKPPRLIVRGFVMMGGLEIGL